MNRNGRQDHQKIGEDHEEDGQWRRRKGGKAAQDGAEGAVRQARGAEAPLGRQPADREGYGDARVQAYIAAMPGWKREIGRRLDAIIVREVPDVKKAVKWNSPFYGVEEGVWFLSFHCFTRYVKVTFFRGASLSPVPAGASKHKEVRYLDIYEGEFDEAQFAAWVKQASQLPGERL